MNSIKFYNVNGDLKNIQKNFSKNYKTKYIVNDQKLILHPNFKEVPCEDTMNILQHFSQLTQPPNGTNIKVHMRRITCGAERYVYPSLNEKKYRMNGIFCVARENVRGGLNEFKKDKEILHSEILHAGEFVIFDTDVFEHRETLMQTHDLESIGYRDVIKMYWD